MQPKPFAQLIDLLGRCGPFTADDGQAFVCLKSTSPRDDVPARSPGPWPPDPPSAAPMRKSNWPSTHRFRPIPWSRPSATSSTSENTGPEARPSSWTSCNHSRPAKRRRASRSSSKTALALWRAILTLADSGIELKFRRLHEGAPLIDLREDLGDAYCKNDPPDASPDFDPSPQPTETEEVTTP